MQRLDEIFKKKYLHRIVTFTARAYLHRATGVSLQVGPILLNYILNSILDYILDYNFESLKS